MVTSSRRGTDFLTPQLRVTFRFQEREVAFSGDIQEMFRQVGIRKEDRRALLFVYRNSPSEPLVTMVSDVAILGATCSPAQLRLNATKYEQEYPNVRNWVSNWSLVLEAIEEVNPITVKSLGVGISWLPGEDFFFFTIFLPEVLESETSRSINLKP